MLASTSSSQRRRSARDLERAHAPPTGGGKPRAGGVEAIEEIAGGAVVEVHRRGGFLERAREDRLEVLFLGALDLLRVFDRVLAVAGEAVDRGGDRAIDVGRRLGRVGTAPALAHRLEWHHGHVREQAVGLAHVAGHQRVAQAHAREAIQTLVLHGVGEDPDRAIQRGGALLALPGTLARGDRHQPIDHRLLVGAQLPARLRALHALLGVDHVGAAADLVGHLLVRVQRRARQAEVLVARGGLAQRLQRLVIVGVVEQGEAVAEAAERLEVGGLDARHARALLRAQRHADAGDNRARQLLFELEERIALAFRIGGQHHAAGRDLDRARVQAQLLADQRERAGHQVGRAGQLAHAQRRLRIGGGGAAQLHLLAQRRQLGALDHGDAMRGGEVGGQHRLQAGAQRFVAADRARALEVDDGDADRGIPGGGRCDSRHGQSRKCENGSCRASHTHAGQTLNTGEARPSKPRFAGNAIRRAIASDWSARSAWPA